jgi:hypothetical protein
MVKIWCENTETSYWITELVKIWCENTEMSYWITELVKIWCENTEMSYWIIELVKIWCENTEISYWITELENSAEQYTIIALIWGEHRKLSTLRKTTSRGLTTLCSPYRKAITVLLYSVGNHRSPTHQMRV